MAQGFLYVLVNPAMPGLAKVGKTTRLPSERVAELSSATGVPSPFVLVYEQPVQHCHAAEAWVHAQLERSGNRRARNREFFDAPLHEIVKTIFEASTMKFPDVGTERFDTQEPLVADGIAEALYRQACLIERGDPSNLPNSTQALKLYQEAARLGHRAAQATALDQCLKCRDWPGALDICTLAIDSGDWGAEATRGYIFEQAGHKHLAEERRVEFFRIACEKVASGDLGSDSTELVGAEGRAYVDAVMNDRSRAYLDDEYFVRIAPLILRSVDCRIADLEKQLEGSTPRANARIERNGLLRMRSRTERMLGECS